jgi:hypothetical protein
MKKCIHIVDIDKNGKKYLPKLRKLTIPTITRYAESIKAEVNFIKERKYSKWPIVYEKMQVYDCGKGYDWNILLDIDYVISPKFPDVTKAYTPDIVSFSHSYHARTQLKPDYYFLRDGRNVGIAANFVVTSKWTHDLWEPLDIPLNEALQNVVRHHVIDEYCLSRNLAKYGLKYAGVAPTPNAQKLILHLGAEEEDEEETIKIAKKFIQQNNIN